MRALSAMSLERFGAQAIYIRLYRTQTYVYGISLDRSGAHLNRSTLSHSLGLSSCGMCAHILPLITSRN
jgi:hypothetical protein